MADLAQMKYLADSIFPPNSLPSPSCRTIGLSVYYLLCESFKWYYTQNTNMHDDSTKDQMK